MLHCELDHQGLVPVQKKHFFQFFIQKNCCVSILFMNRLSLGH
jgi:hypothetical protein